MALKKPFLPIFVQNKNTHNFISMKFSGIFDLEGLSLQHIWNLSPSVAKKIISLMVVSITSVEIFKPL